MTISTARGRDDGARLLPPFPGRFANSPGARQFAFFLLFGGSAALANLLVGWLLYGTGLSPALPYWSATGIAAAAGLVINFALNYAFNFRFRQRSALRQFATFCAVALVGVALTSALSDMVLALLAPAASGLRDGGQPVALKFVAHVVAVALVAVYSFFGHKYLSFNIGIYARLNQLRLLLAGSV